MTCILKDMDQGEGREQRAGDFRGLGHDILEASGGGHFGEHGTYILENMYFVGQREEKCQNEEQCVQNYLSKTKIFVSEETLLQG